MIQASVAGRIRYGTSGVGTPQFRGGVLALCVALLLASASLAPFAPRPQSETAPAPPADPAKARVVESYGKLPLSFEENRGQADPAVRFLARGGGYALFLTPTEVVLTLPAGTPHTDRHRPDALRDPLAAPAAPTADESSPPATTVRFSFPGANPDPLITAEDALPGTVNYFIGNDPAQWRTNIGTAAKVRYHDLYPGIDAVFYGDHDGQMEYDLIVAPHADPAQFALSITGSDTPTIQANGGLSLGIAGGYIQQRPPVMFQEVNGLRHIVNGGYSRRDNGNIGFVVGAYQDDQALVIDPVTLVFSTLLGSNSNINYAIAVDNAGNAYAAGGTNSAAFPTTPGAVQATYHGSSDAFVSKLNATGSALVYSTYLGGGASDFAYGLAVDSSGNAYVVGTTASGTFPTVLGAYQTIYKGGTSDAFVTKLNASGSALLYSTFFGGGGREGAYSVATDDSGNAYITGSTTSSDFPVTPGAIQTSYRGGDAYVAKINPTGTALVYSCLLSGSNASGLGDEGSSIAVDNSGIAYVTGDTGSASFPTTLGAFQPRLRGATKNAFVIKLNASASAPIYSTYLGGSSLDFGSKIQIDNASNVYVAGTTYSNDFPTTLGALQRTFNFPTEAFVTKLNPSGSALIYSTFLGGTPSGSGSAGIGIVVDTDGNTYVTGETHSIPTLSGAYQTTFGGGTYDGYLVKLNATGSAVLYGTYLGGTGDDYCGGVALDASGNIYVDGYTNSPNFPTSSGAYQRSAAVYPAPFIAKFAFGSSGPPVLPPVNPTQPIAGHPPQSRTIGGFTIYAQSFTPIGNSGWAANGTVWIGEYTVVDSAAITFDGTGLSGSGLVSLMTTSNGSQRTSIFQDSFTVNLTSGVLTPQSVAGYQFKLNNLVGFRITQTLYQITIDVKKGVVAGNVNLALVIPNNYIPKTVSFTLDHLGAVTGSLSQVTVFSLGSVSLSVNKATLGQNGLSLTDAVLQLPAGFGGGSATLAAADARITGDGQFILSKGSAAVAFPSIKVGGDKGFGIEGAMVTLSVDQGIYKFHGAGTFHLPGIVPGGGTCDLDTSFTLVSPPPALQQAALSISGGCFKIPIGTTGFFLTGVHGAFDLADSQTAIDLGIVVEGPTVPGLGPSVTGDLTAHWDTSWDIALSGSLKVFQWQAGNASVSLDAHDGFRGTIHLTGVAFTADGGIHLWDANNQLHFTGDATVTVQVKKGEIKNDCGFLGICVTIPPHDMTGPSASAKFGEFRTPTAPSIYGIKGQVDVFGLRPAFFIDTNNNTRFDLTGLTQYQLVDQTSSANNLHRNAAGNATYSIAVGTTPTLVVGIAFDSGAPTLSLTDPNGRTITASTVDPNVVYTIDPSELLYAVNVPPTGNWTVTVGNLAGSEHYLVDVLGAPLAAAITQIPSLAPTTNGYMVTTHATGATGATYSLYYDNDASGADGKPIATGIPISQTQVDWDTRTAPNGAYYVYAVLDDMPNAPVVAYSASSVTLSDATPPAVPTGLQASATGSDVAVSWQVSSNVDIAGYHISYQQPGGGQTLVADVPSGSQTSAPIHGLNINGNWQVSISAYDINGNESTQSGTVAVPISIVKTFSLTAMAGGSAVASPSATTYTPGTVVSLTATTSAGYVFTGWTVDGADAGTTNPLPLTITGIHAVVANFGPLPNLVSIAPISGSVSGGATVTLTGAGFIAPANVTFDGLAATTTAISADSTQITVLPPVHAPGLVGIGITTPLGTVSLANAYTYGNVSVVPPVRPAPTIPGIASPVPPSRPAPVTPPSGPLPPVPTPRP